MIKAKETFKVPRFMNLPWLTHNYVLEHGFYPEIPYRLEDFAGEIMGFRETSFGRMPCISRTEIRIGDVIIHETYSEWEKDGQYINDRFKRVSEDDMDRLYESKILKHCVDVKERISISTSLLPVGVVVHPPETPQ